MEPDLELVRVRDDESFKIWSHGYPFRTVRWHFHPEYELHLVTATHGARYVGDHIGPFGHGDLVLVGPNLPHNWISDLPAGETVDERCLVLQFTAEFISACIATFPELRFVQRVLDESFRGIRFTDEVAARAAPAMRSLLTATGARRIALFVELIGIIGQAAERIPLASVGFRPQPSAYLETAMNPVLQYVGCNFTADLNEGDLAQRFGRSVSTLSRSFRRHTGMTFVQYVSIRCGSNSPASTSASRISRLPTSASRSGFNNVSNFNRQFLRREGNVAIEIPQPSAQRDIKQKGRHDEVARHARPARSRAGLPRWRRDRFSASPPPPAASAATVTNANGRLPDARSGFDALRGARPSRLRRRDEEALPELQGALPRTPTRTPRASSSSSTR